MSTSQVLRMQAWAATWGYSFFPQWLLKQSLWPLFYTYRALSLETVGTGFRIVQQNARALLWLENSVEIINDFRHGPKVRKASTLWLARSFLLISISRFTPSLRSWGPHNLPLLPSMKPTPEVKTHPEATEDFEECHLPSLVDSFFGITFPC